MIKQIAIALLCVFLFSCVSEKSEPAQSAITTQEWAFPYFEKIDSINPILSPSAGFTFTDPLTGNTVPWEKRNVLNPTAVVRNDTIHLLYRAQDTNGTSRIGLATSVDGLHFTKNSTPVFYPDKDEEMTYEWNYKKIANEPIPKECTTCLFDGVEDPRIVESEDGTYIMTYTAYDGKTARLSSASSSDLRTWQKHGLVLADEKYRNTWSKAGAIVAKRQGNKMLAHKINGRYWMYFGDTSLFMATSTDLVHWDVATSAESGKMIAVLNPRPGYYDSRLVEPGPYALFRDEGILLIYNASNAKNYNTPTLPVFTYAAGQALFDHNEPYKLLDRTDTPFIAPDKDYEKVGEVNEVCFVEGLVFFKNSWYLYYGTADSKIAVAVYDPNKKITNN